VMRAGSGAVLLVGFALVVMLLSVAGALTSPAIGMKQDPSQDFADIAASIREITYACGNFRGNTSKDIEEYYNATLTTLSKQLEEKGIVLSVRPDVTYDYTCSVWYKLQSNDKSTYVEGFVSTNASLARMLRELFAKGLVPLNITPPVLCNDTQGKGMKNYRFLISNPNKVKVHVVLEYKGNGNVKKLQASFPGQGIGTIQGNITEFYLDPMTQPTGGGVSVGQRNSADCLMQIQLQGNQSGLVGNLIITIPEYNFIQEVPVYWNDWNNGCVVPWGQALQTLNPNAPPKHGRS